LGALIAAAEVNPLTSGISYGPLCAAKAPLGALVSRATTRTSAPSWLRCSFPRIPLIEITSLPNNGKRVGLVLKPKKLVISIDLKTDGSTLRYAKSDCSRSAL
jgi:hypothetical protein